MPSERPDRGKSEHAKAEKRSRIDGRIDDRVKDIHGAVPESEKALKIFGISVKIAENYTYNGEDSERDAEKLFGVFDKGPVLGFIGGFGVLIISVIGHVFVVHNNAPHRLSYF